jgi:hypothetical protein
MKCFVDIKQVFYICVACFTHTGDQGWSAISYGVHVAYVQHHGGFHRYHLSGDKDQMDLYV